MEVRKGYKQTEVGILPREWEVKKLGELASLRTGPFGSSLHKSDYITDGIPFINPTHIFDGELFPDRNITVSKEAVMRLSEFRLRTNDIILGRRGEMGRCAVVKENQQGWLCGSGSLIMRPNAKIVPEFLRRIISSPQVIAKIEEASVGSTMINLNQTVLFGLRIQTPPLPEQQAIAAALSDVDSLLTALDALIAKKRLIKQGAMQELLTGKKRLPGFSGKGYKKTDFGNIPDDWEVKQIGDLFEITSSKRVFQNEWKTSGIPFYRARELAVLGEQGYVNNELFITKEMYASYKNIYGVPKIGDMLVTGVGTLGKVYVVSDDREFYFKDGNIIWFKNSGKVSPEFLRQLYLTKLIMKQIEDGSAGTTVGTYTITGAKKTIIPYPSLPEQTAIAEILSDMDAEISALETRREKTRLLKQGMMQELLTGRIRLV